MIDTSGAKWNLSKEEQYVVDWLNERGYAGRIVKQYISKTAFIIMKDGIIDKLTIPQGLKDMNIADYMQQYERSWKLMKKLRGLKKYNG